MKEGWEYKKLGEVATYINGFPFKPSDWKEIGKPIIRIQNLTNPHGGFNRCSRNDIPEKYFVVKGDVLISWSATLGVFEWESEDALLNQHIFKVVFDKADIDKHFFKYAVLMSITEMAKHTNGDTMKHIRKGDFDNIKIPYPSLSEQQSIVDYLDSAFAKIDAMKANAEKTLNEAKALFQASLKEMLEPKEGWKEKKLGEVCEKITDGSHNPPKGVVKSENLMLSSQNIQNDYLDMSNARYISDEDFRKENQRTSASKGDVLLTIVGTIGRTCVLKGTEGNITFQRSVAVLKPSSNILSRFLMFFLLSQNSVLNTTAQGAAQKGIYLKQLGILGIFYPPLSDQQSIVDTLDSLKSKVDRLKANFEKISKECDALKQALLKEVFER